MSLKELKTTWVVNQLTFSPGARSVPLDKTIVFSFCYSKKYIHLYLRNKHNVDMHISAGYLHTFDVYLVLLYHVQIQQNQIKGPYI